MLIPSLVEGTCASLILSVGTNIILREGVIPPPKFYKSPLQNLGGGTFKIGRRWRYQEEPLK